MSPAVSKSQFILFKSICEGSLPDGHRGISKETACEFVKGQSPKGLPARKKKLSNPKTETHDKQWFLKEHKKSKRK